MDYLLNLDSDIDCILVTFAFLSDCLDVSVGQFSVTCNSCARVTLCCSAVNPSDRAIIIH